MPCSAAISTDRLEGAPTVAITGTPTMAAFCTNSKLMRPLSRMMWSRKGIMPSCSAAPISLSSALCRPTSSRYFKTNFNTTPNVFINLERLRQAYQMMQNDPSLSVRTFCQEVGFKSTSYFIKLFKEQYGLTPKQYLMSLRNKMENLDYGESVRTNTRHYLSDNQYSVN